MKVLIASRFARDAERVLRERFPEVAFLSSGEEDLPRDPEVEACYFGSWRAERLRALLAALPGLRWIHTGATGLDGLLVPELVERDELVVTNSSGVSDVPIAEHVIALILAAAKQLPAHLRAQQRHEWRGGDEGERHAEVRGATLVVVGLGSIGGEIARLAAAVGMRVIGVRRSGRPSPHVERVVAPDRLASVAGEADYLAIACPLTSETRGLVSREVVAALPAHAWVVNIARGAIVDEQALLAALRERRIGGAAIDTWWEEPLPKDTPWWDLENVIVTPHRSWSSPRSQERWTALFAENLRRYRAGEPLLNVVDKRLGY